MNKIIGLLVALLLVSLSISGYEYYYFTEKIALDTYNDIELLKIEKAKLDAANLLCALEKTNANNKRISDNKTNLDDAKKIYENSINNALIDAKNECNTLIQTAILNTKNVAELEKNKAVADVYAKIAADNLSANNPYAHVVSIKV